MKKEQICTKAVHECLLCNGCKWCMKWKSHALKLVTAHRSACLRQAGVTARKRGSYRCFVGPALKGPYEHIQIFGR